MKHKPKVSVRNNGSTENCLARGQCEVIVRCLRDYFIAFFSLGACVSTLLAFQIISTKSRTNSSFELVREIALYLISNMKKSSQSTRIARQ